ncbi:hypothetical protein PPL_09021 [Heterostelium album PN500]|uniref:Acyltransferase 3 domain-containing protein n=1 Tax=Heterostelium pallidum (strain ATCC 26659 / Pp 5 / PN500) TaxID=670386 RepID=D3BKE0_HETP5|nr:hypothetical protein PPL_09021 [Heterostelium album PN500]EFA78370.1 hypothetical protein PPL_09021 [Heterostelium album PN500]|eukprot:XP_020430495.1 hypothetical protein PPL_09021 [Heterostelium album PN500]
MKNNFILFLLIINLSISLIFCQSTDSSSATNQPSQCSTDIDLLASFSYSSYMDSMKMWMYMGRSPNELGNMEQCLMLPPNVTHYCVYQTSIVMENMTLPYVVGLCFPKSCNTTDDVQSALNRLMMSSLIIAPPGSDTQTHFYTRDPPKKNWTVGAGIVLGFCVLFAILVAIGTSLELIRSYMSKLMMIEESKEFMEGGTTVKLFLSFSLIKNCRAFMFLPESRSFDSLDGVRVLAAIWIVISHTGIFQLFPMSNDMEYFMAKGYKSYAYQAINSSQYAVDLFFMITGFLVSHILLKSLESNKSRNPLFWVIWGWYLANDTQFYLIAPFVLVAYKYRKIYGYILVAILFGISLATSIWISVENNIVYDISVFLTPGANEIYVKPWVRIGPFAFGIALEFIYRMETTKRLYEITLFRYIAYAFSLGLSMFLAYIQYDTYLKTWSPLIVGLYLGFSRTLFPAAISISLLSTFYGHGGYYSKFLKLSCFRYLSKLTFAMYLINPIVIYSYNYSRTSIPHYSVIEHSYQVTSNLVFTILLSIILHLTVEKPFVNLQRILLPTNTKNNNNNKPTNPANKV